MPYFITLNPVSYTHLDVYKRQRLRKDPLVAEPKSRLAQLKNGAPFSFHHETK